MCDIQATILGVVPHRFPGAFGFVVEFETRVQIMVVVSDNVRIAVAEFLTLHMRPRVNECDVIIQKSAASSTDMLFQELFATAGVQRLVDHDGALRRLQEAVPQAALDDCVIALARAEAKGFSEVDARRALERAFGVVRARGASVISAAPSQLSSSATCRSPRPDSAHAPSAALTDPIAEEMRDWIGALLGTYYSEKFMRRNEALPKLLQDGVVLLIVAQRLINYALDDADVKLPKRSDGFFGRENVQRALSTLVSHLKIQAELAPDASDVCDGKQERSTVSFLLHAARRVAADESYAGPLPEILRLEADIDKNVKEISDAEVSAAIMCSSNDVTPPGEPRDLQNGVAAEEFHSTPTGYRPPTTKPIVEPTSLFEPEKPADRVVSKAAIASCVEGIKRQAPLETNRYVPRPSDELDGCVAAVVNRTMAQCPKTQTRVRRLPHDGAYVLYHRVTGKRSVVHVRVVRSVLMIRVGGGWDHFESWLVKHASLDTEA